MLSDARGKAELALSQPGTLQDRLFQAIRISMLDMLDAMNSTPHGAELIDLKDELAGDIITEWHKGMASLFAKALEAEMPAKAGLTGLQRAHALLNGLEGLKCNARTADERADGALVLVRLVT